MKDQQIGVMEKQILSEENSSPAPGSISGNQKNKRRFRSVSDFLAKLLPLAVTLIKTMKKPKILITFGIIIIISIVFAALLALSSKPNTSEPAPFSVQNTPSPSPVTSDELDKIINAVDSYNAELEKLDTDFAQLQAPQVNLKISF